MEKDRSFWKLAWEEIRALCILGFPLAASGIAQFLPQQVNLSYAGHIGQHELDTAGLSISMLVIGGLSIYYGLCYAVMGHYSQAYGRKDYHGMITYLQKTLVLAMYIFLTCSVVFINGEALLVLIGQDRLIASMTGVYLWILLPGALGRLYFHILTRYLECQNLAWPGLLVSCVTAALSFGLHALFVTAMDLGINGAAIALAVTFLAMPILLVIIMFFLPMQRVSLTKWSYEWLLDWKPFFLAAIPSIVQLVTWWASSEIGTFLAGNLSVTELAGQTVLFQFQLFVSLVPSGFAGACCARTGHHLGAGEIRQAKISMVVSLLLHCIFGLLIALAYLLLGRQLAYIFTNDPAVVDEVMNCMVWLAVSDVIETIVYSVLASLRAMHRHTVTMVLTMVSYYVVSLPLMVWMMFFTPLRLSGFWISHVIGATLQASSFVIYLLYLLHTGKYVEVRPSEPQSGESSSVETGTVELSDGSCKLLEETSPLLPSPDADISVKSFSSVGLHGSIQPIRTSLTSKSTRRRARAPSAASLRKIIAGKLLGSGLIAVLLVGYVLLAVFQDFYLPPLPDTPDGNTTGNPDTLWTSSLAELFTQTSAYTHV